MFVKYVGKLNCPPSRMTQGNLGCMRTDEGRLPWLEDHAAQAQANEYQSDHESGHPVELAEPAFGRIGAEAQQQEQHSTSHRQHVHVAANQREW